MDGYFGWRKETENHAEILARSLRTYAAWYGIVSKYKIDAPKEMDPRGYLVVHNQGSVGSCQGQSLADAAEASHFIETGEIVELSRSWCYLRSQHYGGYVGRDVGSNLSDGTKVLKVGCPLEGVLPYVASYGTIYNEYKSKYEEILKLPNLYKLEGEVPLSNYDDIFVFLSSQSGVVQIGIAWGIPDTWELKSYRAGGGGHAVNFVGYLIVQGWPKPGLLMKNSWGTNWGRGGYQLWHPDAVDQMCKYRGNVAIGRSRPVTPKPKVIGDI